MPHDFDSEGIRRVVVALEKASVKPTGELLYFCVECGEPSPDLTAHIKHANTAHPTPVP